MSMGTVEPIGGVDSISFIRGAVEKYQDTGIDNELLDYIEQIIIRARQDKENAEQHPKMPCLGYAIELLTKELNNVQYTISFHKRCSPGVVLQSCIDQSKRQETELLRAIERLQNTAVNNLSKRPPAKRIE